MLHFAQHDKPLADFGLRVLGKQSPRSIGNWQSAIIALVVGTKGCSYVLDDACCYDYRAWLPADPR
jgi:hypothetical protein